MTALTMTLGRASWNGISARVTRVGEADGRRASRMVTRKVVVSSAGSGATSVDVPPGEYFVEAVLPTGEVVTGVCVVAGTGPMSIDIGGLRSSDGSTVTDRMPRQGTRDYRFPSAAGMLSMSRLGDHPDQAEPGIFSASPAMRSAGPGTGLPTGRPGAADGQAARPGPAGQGAHGGRMRFPLASRSVPGPDGGLGYEIDAQGVTRIPGPLWMEFDSGGRVEKAMLPVPWLPEADASRLPGGTRIRVDVPASGIPRVSVGESRFDAMLGYLANRRISEAGTALEALAAEPMPVSPPADDGSPEALVPFAYLAACYVGILGHARSTERWGRLAQRLHQACPASVDAMVATARYLLVTARDTDDLDRARSLFLEASAGPPPTLTVGVQVLLDGLSAFADEDEMVAARRKDFMQVARSVDTGQPFTVLTCVREPA